MKITRVTAIPYEIPYRQPARFASGAIEVADSVLIGIETDEGLTGFAEMQARPYTYGDTQQSLVRDVEEKVAPAICGLDPLATERIAERCRSLRGSPVVRGSVDLAVWDLVGKVLEQPCHMLLGGYGSDIEVAHIIGFDEPSAMAATAQSISEECGVNTFKIKVGRDLGSDTAACRAIREVVPEGFLYLDANRGWSAEDAIRAADELADLGVAALEEPIPPASPEVHQRVSEAWGISIIGDETCTTLEDVGAAVASGIVDRVSIKTARTGFIESRRILDLCIGTGTTVVVGSQYEGGVGVSATISFACAFGETAMHAAEATNIRDLTDDIAAADIPIQEGRMAPSSRPGLGVDIDFEKLDHYRLDSRSFEKREPALEEVQHWSS